MCCYGFHYIILSKQNYIAKLSCCLLHSVFLSGLFFYPEDGCGRLTFAGLDTDPDAWSFMANHEANKDWSLRITRRNFSPTAEHQVRSQVRLCGICGGETLGQVFSQYLFPLPIFIPPTAWASLITI
jgi:hypothetical protein